MEDCDYCGAKFDVKFDDPEEHELNYCPSCGEDLWEDEDDETEGEEDGEEYDE
tara:strand:- start:4575 stop:4733 length:159 start_codon:yes stop_codon:yes gene_type:complete